MNRIYKTFALSAATVLALAVFAGCGKKGENETPVEGVPVSARICYDNLPDDGIAISEADTKVTVAGADLSHAYAVDGNGEFVDYTQIVSYANDTFTALSEGAVYFQVKGTWCRVEVTPAYAVNPGNQYSGNSGLDLNTNTSRLLGKTHDPSLIEVTEDDQATYYIFSTGWETGNEVRKSTDLKTWSYVGKTHTAADYTNEEIFPEELKEWMNSTNNSGDLQWWAPDIVPAPDGGYWLYTCLVMADGRMPSHTSSDTAFTPSARYSQACIVLYHIADLSQIGQNGATQYVGVLMQSAIPQDGSVGNIDINSIDPQIIYGADGEMYMAYGSFGTGNWLLELDPATGLRKDNVYADGQFKAWDWVRKERNKIVSGDENSSGSTTLSATEAYAGFTTGETVSSEFYGTLISLGAMEAPVLARHDNVKIADETATYDENGEPQNVAGKTYYYSMHSYNWLESAYQMWGGRSESVWGAYNSVNGGIVYNKDVGSTSNQGNKYMGAFQWSNKTTREIDPVLTGHNDLFTTGAGVNAAAYITRTWNYGNMENFLVQIHQYYLNSMGDVCINPNRYGGEIDRSVSAEELFAYTDNGKFQMIVLANANDATISSPGNNASLTAINNRSVEVTLTEDGKIMQNTAQIGTWVMYGKGYIKLNFTQTLKTTGGADSGEQVYYGVVRPAWLYEQGKSGFTITCMGHTNEKTNMALFLNAQSAMTGSDFAE